MTLLRFCDCKGNKTFLFVKIFIELFFCGSWERFQIRSGVSVCLSLTAPPRGASGECGYCVTAWRTTCLSGVTYSRASPRLFAYITSEVSAQIAPPQGASGKCECCVTAWRTTCLYGVTYSRASPRLYLGAIFVSSHLSMLLC